jgi:hypothetical protein
MATAAASVAGVLPGAGLEGDWEMVIVNPKRPWIFEARFTRAGGGWAGRLRMRGLPEVTLQDIRAESARVRFRFPPELDSAVFDGVETASGIDGHVQLGGERFPTRLTRERPLPRPADRLEAWRQDLELAERKLSTHDRSFTPASRRAFHEAMARLVRDLHTKRDEEILVDLSRAVALADNAHTRLRLDPTRQGSLSTVFPIRMWWFGDGAFVVRAAPPYARALRCRVVAIDGLAISVARDRVRGLIGGNEAWAGYLSPLYLANPDILDGLGLIRSAREARFTFEDPRGRRFDLAVRAEAEPTDAGAGELWQELSPLVTTGRPAWHAALAADFASLPLYLRHPERPYWYEYFPESGLLYLQYNRSTNAGSGPGFREFGDSLVAFARRHAIGDVVVDLRLNSGGDLTVAREFMAGLGRSELFGRTGRLFVITSHCTFSAGLFHAAQLRQAPDAILVGDTPGDRLDFWAEGGGIELPNSGAVITYSNGFHGYSGRDFPEHRPYYEEMRVADLVPDLPAALTSGDYFSGRDPALEAIRDRTGR